MTRRRFLTWAIFGAVFVGVTLASASRPAAQTDSPYPSGEMTTERPMSLPSPDLARLAEAPTPAPPSAAVPAALPSPSAVVPVRRTATIAEARTWARRQLGARQFACLDALVQRESRWNPRARNRHSGAYGLPQAYPPEKMAWAGSDWRTNPRTQLRWMIAKVHGGYGSACAAYRHALREGWY